MFVWKVSLYENVGGKERKIDKTFDDRKDFDAFVEKNPDLKRLRDFEWMPLGWSDSLAGISRIFDELESAGNRSLLKRMEEEAKAFFERSKELVSGPSAKKLPATKDSGAEPTKKSAEPKIRKKS